VEVSKQNIEGELKLELEKVKADFAKITNDKSSVDERNQVHKGVTLIYVYSCIKHC